MKKILYLVWGRKLTLGKEVKYYNEYQKMMDFLETIPDTTLTIYNNDNWRETNFDDYDLIFIHSCMLNYYGGKSQPHFDDMIYKLTQTNTHIIFWKIDADHHLTSKCQDIKRQYDFGILSQINRIKDENITYISLTKDYREIIPRFYDGIKFKNEFYLPTTMNIYEFTPYEKNDNTYALSFGSHKYKSAYRKTQSHKIAQALKPTLFHWKIESHPELNPNNSITYLEQQENYQTFLTNMKSGLTTLIIGLSDKKYQDIWLNRFSEAIQNNVLPLIDKKSLSQFTEQLPEFFDFLIVDTDEKDWDINIQNTLEYIYNNPDLQEALMMEMKFWLNSKVLDMREKLTNIIQDILTTN